MFYSLLDQHEEREHWNDNGRNLNGRHKFQSEHHTTTRCHMDASHSQAYCMLATVTGKNEVIMREKTCTKDNSSHNNYTSISLTRSISMWHSQLQPTGNTLFGARMKGDLALHSVFPVRARQTNYSQKIEKHKQSMLVNSN